MRREALRWIMVALVTAAFGAPALAGKTVAYLRLKGEVSERHRVAPIFDTGDQSRTLREIVEAIDGAALPERGIDGLVIRATDMALNSAQIDEIGEALLRFRAAGKKAAFFADIYGPGELALASYTDAALMQSGGAVSLPGLYMEEMFLADALRWIGVTPDFVQIGDYKGAKEMYANSAPSPEWDRNINQLLDGLYARTLDRLGKGRGLSREQVEKAMGVCFLADGKAAIEQKLIDATIDRMDLEPWLEKEYGEDFGWDAEFSPEEAEGPDLAGMGFFEAFARITKMLAKPAPGAVRDTIAVVHIDGAIVDGESTDGGLLGEASVGSATIRDTLADLEDDAKVHGVIVRINSPGGSAIASESIWLGLRRLAELKPVWVSVGSMAASGGYYLAVAGDVVYVTPSSIVGSIGVVGGKMALAVAYEKLRIHIVPRSRGPLATVMGALNPWSEAERELVRVRMTETYDLFVSRVKAGRKGIDISKTAEGRLFVGEAAVALKMADRIGGIEDAIGALAAELSLKKGAYDVVDYPAPKSFEEMLKGYFPGAAGAARAPAGDSMAVGALRELVGPEAWRQLRSALGAAMLLRREPVILVAPSVLIVR